MIKLVWYDNKMIITKNSFCWQFAPARSRGVKTRLVPEANETFSTQTEAYDYDYGSGEGPVDDYYFYASDMTTQWGARKFEINRKVFLLLNLLVPTAVLVARLALWTLIARVLEETEINDENSKVGATTTSSNIYTFFGFILRHAIQCQSELPQRVQRVKLKYC